MSSVPNMRAAQTYVEPRPPNPSNALQPGVVARDPLAELWENLVLGRVRPLHEGATPNSVRFVARIAASPLRPLCPDEALLVRNVLCGDPRKALAYDHRIAVSTVTGRYLRSLSKFGLPDCAVPLALVLSAQSHAALVRIPSARATYVDHDGCRCLSVSIPRPVTTCLTELTPVQQQIALWLIVGASREDIAERRCKSVHTVAGQVHAVFHALRVTGRYALIRAACERGCFRQPAESVA